jgi:adenylate cyclase
MAPDRQGQLTALLQRITLARSEVQPAVLLFEDLHWFDSGSETVLAGLIDSLAGTRTLLIANYRPEYRGDWMHRSHVQQIALQPLSADAIDALLVDLLGADPSLEELRPRILERTAGNPFFIEEVVRSLAEEGALAGARGHYQLAQPLAEIRIPAAVQNVLAARIDRLLEDQKNVLQTASVIGSEFSEPLLARVAGGISEILSATLAELVSAEFLYERAIYPEHEYAFRHPLTRDVAYESQLHARRANIHAAVAQALEAAHPEKLDEKAAVLAQHWEGAGDSLSAARWHRRAAEWVGLGNPREWSHHFERVRALGPELPPSAEADRLGLLARVQILSAGGRMGADPDHMETVYREAQQLVDRMDEPQARVQLLSAYGFYRQFVTGADGPGTADLERALELADEGDDLAARVVVRYALGGGYMALERYQDALRLSNEGLELLRDDPERASTELGFPSRAGMLFQRAMSLHFLERVSDAGQALELLQGEARAHAHPVSSWFSAQCEALLSLQVGDERRALAAAAEACTVAERTGNRAYCAWSVVTLARAHAANGNHEEALHEGRRAVEIVRNGNLDMMTAMALSYHARVLAGDDPAAAKQMAVEALSAESTEARGEERLTAELAIVLADLKLEGSGARPALEARLERLEEEFGVDSVLARAQIEEVRAAVAIAADDAPARSAPAKRAEPLHGDRCPRPRGATRSGAGQRLAFSRRGYYARRNGAIWQDRHRDGWGQRDRSRARAALQRRGRQPRRGRRPRRGRSQGRRRRGGGHRGRARRVRRIRDSGTRRRHRGTARKGRPLRVERRLCDHRRRRSAQRGPGADVRRARARAPVCGARCPPRDDPPR